MNVYEHNKTMRLLGKQYYNRIVTDEDLKAINDIVEANVKAKRFDRICLFADIFVYGFIMGKRAERSRKKRGKL